MKNFSNITELFDYAKERNYTIPLGWPKVTSKTLDFKKGCKIEHSDGSSFFVTNVLLEEAKFITSFRMDNKTGKKIIKKETEPAYIIYSEHHNPLVYLKSDLLNKPKILIRNKKGEFK